MKKYAEKEEGKRMLFRMQARERELKVECSI